MANEGFGNSSLISWQTTRGCRGRRMVTPASASIHHSRCHGNALIGSTVSLGMKDGVGEKNGGRLLVKAGSQKMQASMVRRGLHELEPVNHMENPGSPRPLCVLPMIPKSETRRCKRKTEYTRKPSSASNQTARSLGLTAAASTAVLPYADSHQEVESTPPMNISCCPWPLLLCRATVAVAALCACCWWHCFYQHPPTLLGTRFIYFHEQTRVLRT